MNLSEKASLHRELAKLITAAFHMDRAVELLLSQKPSHARRCWLEGLRDGLKSGHSVTESLRTRNGGTCDGLELALIDAGERSGRLGDAFAHLARYFEAWHLGARQARSALIYPLVLAHLGIVLPELPAIVTAEMQGTEGPGRRVLITLLVFWLVLVLGVTAWNSLSRRGATSAPVERWLWRLPLVGAVRWHWALARFAQVYHACLLAGMRMTECMRLAGEASHSGVLRQAAVDAEKKIACGELVAGAMADVHGFPLIFVHSVATAEEAGLLDQEMNSWAAAEMIEARESLQRATEWLPRLFYGLVVLYVAWRIIAMVAHHYSEMGRMIENL